MIETFKNIFKIPDLKKRIFFTIVILGLETCWRTNRHPGD